MKGNKLFLAASLAAAMTLAACESDHKSDSNSGITEFDVSQTIVSGVKNYCLTSEGEKSYLSLTASIHWPEKLGDKKVRTLQDSLIAIAFGDSVSHTPREAVERFLADTDFIEAEQREEVKTVPEESVVFFRNVDASVIDLTEDYITYKTSKSAYYGGAHPMSGSSIFTYDLASGSVLTVGNIFKQGVGSETILRVINEALARQFDVSVGNLEQAGFFSDLISEIGQPYILDKVLYFHYNPYEIGPYALGEIDVAVYPGEVSDYLRPEIISLFEVGL